MMIYSSTVSTVRPMVNSWSPKGFSPLPWAQFPRSIANTAVETAYDVLAGETVEKTILIPVHLITAENLNNYSLEGWQ